ncbi:MAG TPA: IS21 family transposase [Planctomycetes bacterium]|nr:IS21 family transposase [Planctomycetota bacterium]
MTRLAIHHQSAVARSHAAIAAAINQSQPDEPVSVRSVRRVLSEPKPDLAALNGDAVGPGPGRPSCAEPFRHQVATLLESESALSTVELLRRCRESGYAGGKSAFYDLVKSVRKPSVGAEPIVRFEGVPGEYAQFDFGERWIEYAGGARRKVIAFVGRLKYSRHVHVEIVPDQKAETLVRAVVACLEAWRCVPLIWVFDNPKTVRTSAIGQPIVIHSYLAGLAAELNAAVLLCTPHQPQQKGAVERGVGWFKNGFLAQRRFVDAADLQSQLTAWLAEANGTRPSDATGEIPAARLVQEQAALHDRPLPFTAAQFALRLPATVLPTGTVHILGTTYSVDPKRVGAPAMVLLRATEVEIVIGGSRCTHRRVDFCDLPQRLPEHRREMLGAVFGERKRNSFQRQCLWELGREAQDFLEGLVHRCGADATGWYRPVAQLYALLEEHGDSVLREAMANAHGAKRHDVPAVVRALRPRAQLGSVADGSEGRP